MSGINSPEVLEYLNSLRQSVDPLLLEMEAFAKLSKIPILDWKSAELIEQFVLIKNPENVLEIGTAIAYTSIRIARRLSGNSKIDTIEISKHNIPLAKENIEKAGLGEKINLLEGNAKQLIPTLQKKYDLIFLDADKLDYLDYYEILVPILKSGGLLIIDNLLWKGNVHNPGKEEYKPSVKIIRELNKRICGDERFESSILPVGDGIGVCIKK